MTFGYFFFQDILHHSAFGIFDSEYGQSLSCFRCMPQNAAYLASFYVTHTHTHTQKKNTATENLQRWLPLKTHFWGVDRSICLSYS